MTTRFRNAGTARWRQVWMAGVCGAAVLGGAQPARAEAWPAVDALVEQTMKSGHIPGIAVAIVRDGRTLLAKGYGYANVEHEVPVTASTIFQTASVGKQFTAVAVMMMVEEGRIGLDEPLTRYFTDAPAAWNAIRVRHLLTHTSGIPDYTDAEVNPRRDYTEHELTRIAYGMPLEFVPGARWNYSNTGYLLLGILIHKVSGRFYGDVLRERVFAPLDMKTARVISEADIVPHRSAGYEFVDGAVRNQTWVSPMMNTTADGALYLCLDDYIAWIRGLTAGALLEPGSWQAIYTPVTLNDGSRYPYGFGWRIDEVAGKPFYHHSGSWQGFRTYISRYLAGDGVSVVVLANMAALDDDDNRVEDLAYAIAAAVDPALAATPRE